MTATNDGTGPAPNATVVDMLPADVTFASASSGCTQSARKVECDLGTLEDGASQTVTIVVTPKRTGTVTNTATVGSDAPDPNPADNAMTITTTVAK